VPRPEPFPFDKDYFERHKEELRRQTLLGRVALVGAIFLLLLANLYFTHRSMENVVANIDWARLSQGMMEDDVGTRLRAMEARLTTLEEQNRKVLEAMEKRRDPRADILRGPLFTRREGSVPVTPKKKGEE
jgi:hypothetical protein